MALSNIFNEPRREITETLVIDRLIALERVRPLTGRENAELTAALGGLPITITQERKPERGFSRANAAMLGWSLFA